MMRIKSLDSMSQFIDSRRLHMLMFTLMLDNT